MKPALQNGEFSYKWKDFNISKEETISYEEVQDIRGLYEEHK